MIAPRQFRRLLVLLVLALGARHATADDAAITRARNAVALLQDGSLQGSGVVVSHKGLILTDAIFAVGPLPVQVTVTVKLDGRVGPRRFKARPVGVHPELNLGLLQIQDLGQALLAPADLATTNDDSLAPGADCLLLAPLEPESDAPQVNPVVTYGMVNAVNRQLRGRTFFQFSAKVTARALGAPVVDASGRVLGIVAFQDVDTERIAFASSCVDLRMADFGPADKRRRNPDRADRLRGLSAGLLAYAPAVGDDEMAAYMRMVAVISLRSALAETPGDRDIFLGLSEYWVEQGGYDIAAIYMETARRAADDGRTELLRAKIAMGREQVDVAQTHAIETVRRATDDASVAGALWLLTDLWSAQGRVAAAAYACRWYSTLGDRVVGMRRFVALSQHLDDATLLRLRQRRIEYSLAEMQELLSHVAVSSSGPRPTLRLPVSHDMPAEGVKLGRLVCMVAATGAIADPMVDRFAICKTKDDNQLALVDLVTGGVMHEFPAIDGILGGAVANGRVHIILARKDGSRPRYDFSVDLATGEVSPVRELANLVPWQDLLQSENNPRLMLMHGHHQGYAVYDIVSREITPLADIATSERGKLPRSLSAGRARVAFVAPHTLYNNPGIRTNDVHVVSWANGRASQRGFKLKTHDVRFYIVDDRISTYTGQVYDLQGNLLYAAPPEEDHPTVPVAGTPYIFRLIEVQDGRSRRYRGDFIDPRNGTLVASLAELVQNEPSAQDLFVMPHLRRVVIDTNYGMWIVPMPELGVVPAGAAGPAPGGEWRHDLGLKEGSVVVIERGPDGMRYDAATSMLIWDIPANQRLGKTAVILSIREPGEAERIQRLNVEVQQ